MQSDISNKDRVFVAQEVEDFSSCTPFESPQDCWCEKPIFAPTVISMHSDISKKDHEYSKNFPVVMMLYNPYNWEKEYKGLNRNVTPAIYLKLWTIRGNHK